MENYLFESSCILVGMYVFYEVVLQKDFFFQRNRFFLLGSVLLAFLLPLCEWGWVNVSPENNSSAFLKTLKLDFIFSQNFPKKNISSQNIAYPSAHNQNITNQNLFWDYANIIWIIYVCVCAILMFRLMYQLFYLFFWINQSKRKYQRAYIRIDTEGKMPTFSFFNYLFWDNTQNLTQEEQDQILHHEQKHIWDRHSYDTIFLEIAKIIWWFNPVIYLIYTDIRLQHEYLADASVLRESSIKKYAKTLVKVVFQHQNLPLVHSFNQQEIKNRLFVMQENQKSQDLDAWTESKISSFQPPKDFYKIWWALPLVLVFFWAFAGEIKTDLRAENRFVNVQGGLDNFYLLLQKEIFLQKQNFLSKNKEKNSPILKITGRVFVEFAVNKNGKLSEFKIIKSLHPLYDKWVMDAIQNLKQVHWLPAKIQGVEVKQKISLPVNF